MKKTTQPKAAKQENKTKSGIKSWALDDRPREKLDMHGPSTLSIAELLTILIGSGTLNFSALDAAKQLLANAQNSLHTLGRQTLADLCKVQGIGKAKAITLLAALELGRRRKAEIVNKTYKILSSKDAYSLMEDKLTDLSYEEIWAIFLNRSNGLIKLENIGKGGLSGTVCDPKVVFKKALDCRASGLILCHNHPSGSLKPSQSDIKLTEKIDKAGKVLEINLLDHLIVCKKNYYSFADNGYIMQ